MARSEVIKKANLKNGQDFDKWIKDTPDGVADIKKVRESTKKISYSMVEESSE